MYEVITQLLDCLWLPLQSYMMFQRCCTWIQAWWRSMPGKSCQSFHHSETIDALKPYEVDRYAPEGTCRCLWWACERLWGFQANPLTNQSCWRMLQAAEQVFPDFPIIVTYANLFRSVIKTGRQWRDCWFYCFLADARQAPLIAVGFWWFPNCSDSSGRNMHMGDLFVGVLSLGWLVLVRC